MKTLTAERLREVLDYFPETGVFRWKIARPGIAVGAVAGRVNGQGYRQICIDGRRYQAHRFTWLYVHDRWPMAEIDHINGIRDDNRLTNLREASRSDNTQNLRRAQCNNKVGLLGVTKSLGKFQAQIKVGGKKLYLGTFETAELAYAAYVAAKRQFHPAGTL